MKLGCVGIKTAYLQSGPFERKICVPTPEEIGVIRGTLWRLRKPAYGINEVDRQWALVLKNRLMGSVEQCRIAGVSQLFARRNEGKQISLMIYKLSDDKTLAGAIIEVKHSVRKDRKQVCNQ